MATDTEDKATIASLTTLAALNQQAITNHGKTSDRIEAQLIKILDKVEDSRKEIDHRVERCNQAMQDNLDKHYVKTQDMQKAITEASKEDRKWHSKQMAKYGIGIVSILSLVFTVLTYFSGIKP